MPQQPHIDDEQAGSATGAPQQAAFQPAQQQQYTPWSSFVSANQDVSEREANKLTSSVQGDVDKAHAELGDAQATFDQGLAGNRKPAAKKPVDRSFSGMGGAAPAPQLSAWGGNQNVTQLPAVAPPRDHPHAPAQQPVSYAQADTAAQAPAAAQPQPSNPWAAFLSPSPAAPPVTRNPGGGLDTIKRLSTLGPGAAGGHPTGPHDLEGAAGAQPWSQLLGDSLKAGEEAHALGSEPGVEALLQRNASSPGNTAFDAALINGAGGQDFQALNRKYGDNQLGKGIVDAQTDAQGRWAGLQGEVDERQSLDHLLRGIQPEKAPAAGAPAADPLNPNADWHPVAGTKAGVLTGNPDDITGNAGTSATSGQWSDADESAFQDALAGAKGPLDANNGQVVIVAGPSNEGIGLQSPGAIGTQAINVTYSKTKDANGNTVPDWNGWWGGASSMRVGDPRVSPATWYALAVLTPRQRAAWWAKNGGSYG